MTADSLRVRILRVGVIGIVVVACVVAAVYYVEAIRDLDKKAGDNSALDFQDRQIAGGSAVLISQDPLALARATHPAHRHVPRGDGAEPRRDDGLRDICPGILPLLSDAAPPFRGRVMDHLLRVRLLAVG